MGIDYIVEQASTYSECLQKIRSKYGERFRELSHSSIRMGGFLGLFKRDGVELTGYLAKNPYVYGIPPQAPAPQQAVGSPAIPPQAPRKPAELDFEEEKRKLLAAAGKPNPELTLLRNEIRDLKDTMTAGFTALPAASKGAAEHPTVTRLEEILSLNDFTPAYQKNLLDRVRKEFSLGDLEDFDTVQDKVVEWIGESVQIYTEDQFQRRPRIIALIGPTGVGKTTTIAKLAAIFGTSFAGKRPQSVRIITIDNFRIGAVDQIKRYGGIMDIPVSSAKSNRELKEQIALNSEGVDLILIDTIGKSPRSAVELAEMKELLDACGSAAEFHLAIAATTKSSDISEILKQYEPFGYRSVVITKMDETIRLGNVISAIADRGKSVSYITEGQKVPMDIQKASMTTTFFPSRA
ncbi:flagellar biosynthesis protein FlhF [Spirochaetia bacterium]|nr:flagellar biosynthesis protein FlhF [Spirochaetia bacterium]